MSQSSWVQTPVNASGKNRMTVFLPATGRVTSARPEADFDLRVKLGPWEPMESAIEEVFVGGLRSDLAAWSAGIKARLAFGSIYTHRHEVLEISPCNDLHFCVHAFALSNCI